MSFVKLYEPGNINSKITFRRTFISMTDSRRILCVLKYSTIYIIPDIYNHIPTAIVVLRPCETRMIVCEFESVVVLAVVMCYILHWHSPGITEDNNNNLYVDRGYSAQDYGLDYFSVPVYNPYSLSVP